MQNTESGAPAKAAPDNASPRFCKDCAHVRHIQEKFPMCAAPQAQIIDLVHGPLNPMCQRTREAKGPCGIEGQLFAVRPADGISDLGNACGNAI